MVVNRISDAGYCDIFVVEVLVGLDLRRESLKTK
jgi:hypothetical protein